MTKNEFIKHKQKWQVEDCFLYTFFLENLNHIYNDNYNKRKWRAKQNADYAFIFLYCQHLTTYYMQMEDDVYTIPNYLDVVKDYISEMRIQWTCLEFSELDTKT